MALSGRFGALLLVGLAVAAAASAQAPAAPAPVAGELSTVIYHLQHQAVSEAVSVVFPLLSPAGAVEVRPGENALVIRDVPTSLERLLPLLREYDQPGRPMRLAVRVVSAAAEEGPATAGGESGLSDELLQRLRELLRFRAYRKVAAADLEVAEGGVVERELDGTLRLDFRMGRLQSDRRIKLYGFRISRLGREPEPAPLIHTNVNLRLDKPMVLGLARTEASETALMVVLQCALVAGDGE